MSRLGFPLLVGVLALVLIGASVWLVTPPSVSYPPLTSRSNQPNGARALRLWLEGLGYHVTELNRRPYAVDADTRLLLVLAPFFPQVTQQEADRLAEWVRGGGTLVVAVDFFAPSVLLKAVGIEVKRLDENLGIVSLAQPVLVSPPLTQVRFNTPLVVDAPGPDVVPLLQDSQGRVVAAERMLGSGRVVVVTGAEPFSNQGLRDPARAALVLNLVRSIPSGATVQFDEVHHGLAEEEGESIMALLLRTTPGRGILLALALGFAYLVLRGRRFGRPRVIWRHASRSAGEYVSAMAMLYRRAGKRGFVATHFERQLRRDAGAALGLATGADEREIADGARRRGNYEAAAAEQLLPVLARLRQGAASDGELLKLVAEGEGAVATLAGRGREPDNGRAAGGS